MSGNIAYYIYPVSKKHNVLRRRLSYPYIRKFQETLHNNPHLQRHLQLQVPAVIDSLKSSCYVDEHGNCVSPTELIDWESIPFHRLDQVPHLFDHQTIRSCANNHTEGLHSTYAKNEPFEKFATIMLMALSMPRIGCSCKQNGGAKYIEGHPLSTALDKSSKDYQSIYAITLMADNGSVHKIVAKITTKLSRHYPDYSYEEQIYNYLNKNGDSSKKFPLLKYYGTIHSKLKGDGIIHTEHNFTGIGQAMIDIDLKPEMNSKYLIPGTEAIVMLFQNVSDTHIETETYIRNIRRHKSSRETSIRAMNLYKLVATELYKLNKIFHLVHGDFHAGNCFLSNNGKSVIIYDFNLSFAPGVISSKLFLYEVYKHYQKYLTSPSSFNKLDRSLRDQILRELYAIDMIRFYGYISYYSQQMFFEEQNTVSRNQIAVQYTRDYTIDLTNTTFLTYNYFQTVYNQDKFKSHYNDTNGFMMSSKYFNAFFHFMHLLRNVYRFNQHVPIHMNPGDFIQRHLDKVKKDPDWSYGLKKKEKTEYEQRWELFEKEYL
jgi:hypothetical protein